MCIAAFVWQAHPLYPLLLLQNRDEPTKPVAWWDGSEILEGKDEVAGGTWFGCSRQGRVAFLTNVLELHALPETKSRGDLPVLFLEAQSLGLKFKDLLGKYGEGEIPLKQMVEKLMKGTVKADESRLPGICSLDWRFNLSSVFVEVDTSLRRYGTNGTVALIITASGEGYVEGANCELSNPEAKMNSSATIGAYCSLLFLYVYAVFGLSILINAQRQT